MSNVSSLISLRVCVCGLQNVCAFTILRSGEVLERGVRRVIRDVPLCSALIQSDPTTGEPYLCKPASTNTNSVPCP